MEDLIARIKRLSYPMEPVSTDLEPQITPIEGLKAVIFDVYGTMIISGSGDISLANPEDREQQMHHAFAALGIKLLKGSNDLVNRFHGTIGKHQELRRTEGIAFPEVELRDVWKEFTTELYAERTLEQELSNDILCKLAIEYECRVNPVWPMPELLNTLEQLESENITLGIVSNAQFFTPLFFPALLGNTLKDLSFSQSCSIWSYELREGKPSISLYQLLVENLQKKDILPSEALYVGNDMRNDIWPAQECGLKTALFAGDQRSLRLRVEDEKFCKIQPDFILTHLDQIIYLMLKR